MSTLLSTDMNITRPTTRLHAPPGGASSISFGGYDEPAAPAPKKVQVVEAPAPRKATAPAPVATTKAEEIKVEIEEDVVEKEVALVVGGSTGADAVVAKMMKALGGNGIKPEVVTVLKVADPFVMAYMLNRAIDTTPSLKCVIALGILTSEPTKAHSATLMKNLIDIGMKSIPVIPFMLTCDSLLEVKAVVDTMASGWADSAELLLDSAVPLKDAPSVAPPAVRPTVTAETSTVDTLMEDFRFSLKAHGATGIFGLARKFKIADDDGSGTLELAEFDKVIAEHDLKWSPAQIKAVFDTFDTNKSGGIDYNEFLVGVRGFLSPRRMNLVLEAFQILDADKSGVVELNDIMAKYNGKKHPDVISGKRTESEILAEFMDTFDGDHDGKVTPKEFQQYYAALSASIDEDDYFELMMRNAWHISGGKGWCENSSCRRVLVTHADGRQTVEEIKNDLGIGATDTEAMILKLKAQGIDDVVGIDMSGSTAGETDTEPAAPSLQEAAKTAGVPATNGKTVSSPTAGRAITGGGARGTNDVFNQTSINIPAPSPSKKRAPGGESSLIFG